MELRIPLPEGIVQKVMTVEEAKAALAKAEADEAKVVSTAGLLPARKGILIGLRKFIDGNKTYIMLVGTIVYTAGIGQGWWPHTYLADAIFGGGTVAAARSAFQKLIDATNTQTAILAAPKTTVISSPGQLPG